MRRFVVMCVLGWTAIGCGSSGKDLAGPNEPAVSAGGSGGGDSDAAPEDAAAEAALDAQQETGGVSAAQACADLGQTLCAKLDECAPLLNAVAYGEVASCASVLASACTQALALEDTSKSPEWTATCVEAVAALGCEELLLRNTPSQCVPPPGPRADGAACGEDGQCASAYCGSPKGGGCGICRQRAPEGGPCLKDDDCVFGAGCAPGGMCARYRQMGEPCSALTPCASNLSCVTKGTNRACELAGLAGDGCEQGGIERPTCNLPLGFFCNPMTQQCQPLALASVGQGCGVQSGGYAVCTASAYCSATGMSGTCVAAAGEGSSCVVETGPLCTPGLACVGGTCEAYEPESCN